MERERYCPAAGLIIATQISHMLLSFSGDFQLFLESVCRLRVRWPTDGNKEINYVCCGHYEPDDHDMTHQEDQLVGNECQQRESGAGVEDDATAAISGAYVKNVRWNVQPYISYADSSHVHVIKCSRWKDCVGIHGCVGRDVGFRNSKGESAMIRRGAAKGDQAVGENVGKA